MSKANKLLLELDTWLNEGVFDPGIFKAVFLAGGPGSGKSFVAKNVTGGQGFRMVNSDELFEYLLKKQGLKSDVATITSDRGQALRGVAKNKAALKFKLYVDGRLGLVIDGTGKDLAKIAKQRQGLTKLGYDTFMVFVNTSLNVALERNKKRKRTVPNDIVTQGWEQVQSNVGAFQSVFGSNFVIVDNSNPSDDDKKVFSMIWKKVMKFARTKPENPLAKQWIAAELEKRKRT